MRFETKTVISETSVNIYQNTPRNIPKDSHLRTNILFPKQDGKYWKCLPHLSFGSLAVLPLKLRSCRSLPAWTYSMTPRVKVSTTAFFIMGPSCTQATPNRQTCTNNNDSLINMQNTRRRHRPVLGSQTIVVLSRWRDDSVPINPPIYPGQKQTKRKESCNNSI